MHFDSKTAAAAIVVFTLFCNVALQYFNVSGTIACTLSGFSPPAQSAAAGAIGR